MTFKASILLAAIAVGFAGQGCPPDPQPPSPDSGDAAPPPLPPAPDAAPSPPAPTDAGPRTVYDDACDALKAIGCGDYKPNCASAMKAAEDGHISFYNPKCLAKCTTRACARACAATVKCP